MPTVQLGDQSWVKELQVGDVVERMLAGVVPMALKVTEVEADVVRCGWWTFDRKRGIEIDDDIPGIVSYLKRKIPPEELS